VKERITQFRDMWRGEAASAAGLQCNTLTWLQFDPGHGAVMTA